MTRHGYFMRSAVMRLLFRAAALFVVLFATAIVYLNIAGIPQWALRAACSGLSRHDFVFKAQWAELNGIGGVTLHGVTLYRKGVVGPPALEAKRAVVTPGPFGAFGKTIDLGEVKVFEAVIRPNMAITEAPRRVPAGEAKSVRARLALRDCMALDLDVKRLDCDVDCDADTLQVGDIRAEIGKGKRWGELTGSALYDRSTAQLRGKINTTLDPTLAASSLRTCRLAGISDELDKLEFGAAAPPRYEMEFFKHCASNGRSGFTGGFWLEDFKYKGVDLLRANGKFKSAWSVENGQTNSVVRIDSLFVDREEGRIKGDLALDLKAGAARFNATSTIDPKLLAQLIGPEAAGFAGRFRFEGPIRIEGRGLFDRADPARTRVKGRVESRGLGIENFVTDECSFDVDIEGLTNTLTRIEGGIWRGKLLGKTAQFVTPSGSRTNVRYFVQCQLTDADFGVVRNLFRKEPDQLCKGRFSAMVEVRGLMGEGNGRTANGLGNITIKEAHIFRLPLFGGLTDFVSRIMPGLDMVLSQTQADCDFVIGNGKCSADKARVLGEVFSMTGNGDYYFDGRLNFNVQLKLLKDTSLLDKVVGAIWMAVGKILEFRLRGTVAEPRWEPFKWPREFLEMIGLVKRRPVETEPQVPHTPRETQQE